MDPILYVDGWLGSTGKQLTVIPRVRFRFANNPTPDVLSKEYERDWLVYPRLYSPRIGIRSSWSNLASYSEDLTNGAWTKSSSTATASTIVSPDGRSVWQKLVEVAATAEHSVSHAATIANPVSGAHEVSVFAVGGLTREFIKLSFVDAGAVTFSAFFNIAAGVALTASAGVTASIVPVGLGAFRCTIRFTPGTSGAGTIKVNIASGPATISYAGNTANGVYLWGAQVTAGSGTPYVSTTTAARTVIVPDVDTLDPFAFLVQEEDPENATSEQTLVRRLFARVPLTQVVPSSIRLTKPSFSGSLPQQIGNYLANQPDTTQQAFDAYFRQVLSGDSGSAAGSGGVLTGGTFTISFDGSTTAALAYNATPAAVQTALNALTPVLNRGGVIVSGDYIGGYLITFANLAAITATSSLTVSGGGTAVTSIGAVNNGFIANLQFNPTVGGINGGTFTITISGQTTGAIAYNASVGTAQAAINALSGVANHGGVTAAAAPDPILYGPGQIQLGFVYSYPAFTVSLASALPAASTATITRLDPYSFNGLTGFHGRSQSIVFSGATVGTRTLTTPAPHGITTADNIYTKIGDEWFFVAAGNFTVPTTSTIGLSAAAAAPAIADGQATEVGKRIRQNYEPGTVSVRCVRTSYFYLPGYTPGITTADDIVPPVYQGDAATMLQLIFGATGTINYDVGELAPWKGPILSLSVVTVRAADL